MTRLRFDPEYVFGRHYVSRGKGYFVVKRDYFDLFLTKSVGDLEIKALGKNPILFVREDGHKYPVEAYFGSPQSDGTICVIPTTTRDLDLFCNWEVPDPVLQAIQSFKVEED